MKVTHWFKPRSGSTARSSWARLQLAGMVLLVASAATFGLVEVASAAGPNSGDTVPGAAAAVTPFTAGTPFSSGQSINVVVPANSIFSPTTNINIVECAAPGGVVPTDPGACDGNTINGPTLKPNADGSINFQTKTGTLYQIFALPDANLGETSGGVTCNLSNSCVLYIGDDQGDFTQPHVWSQAFFVTPNATDSGVNPGDGSAPVAATQPSPTLSTVVASPTTATADGKEVSTITVTLLAAGPLPVAGRTVTLAQGSGQSVITPHTTPNVSDANGQAIFTVTDTTAEPVTYSATDTTDNVAVTQTATVTYAAPVVTDAHSSVVANPTAVATGPSTPSTITVTLRDQAASSQPVANKAVTLSGTGSVVIVPATTPNLTNALGVATFTVTDNTAETATFTATDTTDALVLTSKASVTFGSLTVSPDASTVTAPSPAQVGLVGTTAVVTLLTSPGGSPVPAKMVSLAASSPTATVGPAVATNASGQAMFSVTDTAPETVTLTATDSTDTLVLTQKPQVVFQQSAPSATSSTISPASATSPADGTTQTLITVVIKDQFDTPLSGKTVQLVPSPTGSVQFHPIAVGSASPGVTDPTGTAEFEVDDTVAEAVTFTATDTTDSFQVSGNTVITFTAGAADANLSTVTTNPTSVPSDGTTASTITVTINDHFGNHIAGKAVTVKAVVGSSVLTTIAGTTNQSGQATFTATDATAEVVTYSATDSTDSLPLTGQGVITFGSPPAPPPVPADSSVVANPTSDPADGSTPAMITVKLYDGNGQPVPGKVVTLTASAGSSKVTAVSGTSDNTGTATFSVSDTTPESVTYTATDTTDKVVLTGVTAVVTFTAVTGSTNTATTPSSGGGASVTSNGGTASDSSGGSGGTSSSGGSGSSLAVTGAPAFLPWLIGLGLLFMCVGTIGRRLFTKRAS
jgi:hypothetical protein